MNSDLESAWLDAIAGTVTSYRRMIDATVEQLSDAELNARPAPGFNSVAVLLRHLGGNLRSRWTAFLTTDGEKPDRDRDTEFVDWDGDRASLMAHFDAGWNALNSAIETIREVEPQRTIKIRGEAHTIAQALTRSITHLSYHVGQIAMIGRMVHGGEWDWQSIPPGQSEKHNRETWGTKKSRGVLGEETG